MYGDYVFAPTTFKTSWSMLHMHANMATLLELLLLHDHPTFFFNGDKILCLISLAKEDNHV